MHTPGERSLQGGRDVPSFVVRLRADFSDSSRIRAGIGARYGFEARQADRSDLQHLAAPRLCRRQRQSRRLRDRHGARDRKRPSRDPNKVEFVVVQSDGRFPAALSGKVDFGLCSTTIFPDRAVRIAFTRPYLDTGGSVIARKDAEVKHVKELNDTKFTYAVLTVPPAIARVNSMLPNVKQLLLDSPSALFLAVKTGRATAFGIDKPIADYYEAENQDLVRLNVSGTSWDFVFQDSIFLKPGDFKWWLFLDTWVGELRAGSRYEKYVEWYHKWLKKDPPPQRFYDYNKY